MGKSYIEAWDQSIIKGLEYSFIRVFSPLVTIQEMKDFAICWKADEKTI